MLEINPDIQFKKELIKTSQAPLSKCMQCGTCSVVCSLAPDDKPFPRKEMIWAAWGIRDQLMGNADIWLCHQCGDCSTYCPRGVKPADVLSALRQMSYRYYARPSCIARMMSEVKWLPLALIFPVVIIAVILALAGTLKIPDGSVNYSKFFPHAWLNSSFTLITLISYGLAVYSLKNFIKDLRRQFPDLKFKGGILLQMLRSSRTIAIHTKFGSCSVNRFRKWAHLLVFYGFNLLLLVTVYAIYAALTHRYPLGFFNPFKILGNLAAFMLVIGLGMMIVKRLVGRKTVNSNYSDWLLLISLLLLTLSGVVIEWARFGNWGSAYHLYFFHLVCVWFVIIYLPYTKFGHTFYRLVAISVADAAGRK
ncbi:MAG: quinone-interacting membrane-bound oxidoreductase complex subunit QmoC [Bacteroidales bacterium]|nr:quinone-interacting membrane-bound oxidoreductase complex subunit QmoC [Bacteroidales bacterium]